MIRAVPGSLAASRIAVVAAAAMFGLTYSLSAPLIALRLTAAGADETLIGINAAMHAVGVLLVAPILPALVSRFNMRILIAAALLLTTAALAGFAATPEGWPWFLLRILLGASAEILFVLSETWMSQLSSETNRARLMAVYMTAMSLGFAAGPLVLAAVGPVGALPFLVGALPPLLAAALMAWPGVGAPPGEPGGGGRLWRYIGLAPIGMAATFLNAAVETAGLSFLALYAINIGWTESRATHLVAALMFGAIAMQLPIGWLGDRMDRLRLVAILAAIAGAGALLWPFVLAHVGLAFAVVFVWGGLFVGIYTLMLTIVGSRFQGAELVGIYAMMGLVWGAGALFGPVAAGLSMDLLRHGLPIFVAVMCLAFFGLVLRLSPRRPKWLSYP